MNPESVIRARIVLRNVGHIVVRMKERERVRKVLYDHLNLLEQKPTKTGVKQLPLMVETVVARERELLRRGVLESERVKHLSKKLSEVSFYNENLENQISQLKRVKKPVNDPKTILRAKIQSIEAKFKSIKNVPPKDLKKIKEKINELKRKLKDL